MPRKYEPRSRFAKLPIASWVLALAWAGLASPTGAAARVVDLELVLAVDVSGSMSQPELLVQRYGYIAALRSPDIAAAISNRGAVALAYLEWAGPNEQKIVVPWTILTSAADARRFANMLADSPLDPGFSSPPWETGTSISRGLLFAADMFSSSSVASRTIDISGNGPNNSGGSLAEARARVIARGITINGLPIVSSTAGSGFPLDFYYEDCVIGGPGAFAIGVDHPSRFETAIRRKLVLEIASAGRIITPVSFVSADASGIDCPSATTATKKR